MQTPGRLGNVVFCGEPVKAIDASGGARDTVLTQAETSHDWSNDGQVFRKPPVPHARPHDSGAGVDRGNYFAGQGCWLVANLISVARCFVLHRPPADTVKESALTALTLGLIVYYAVFA